MATTTCEILWILNRLQELHINSVDPINMHCDNKAAMLIATNPVLHEKTKHFEIDLHVVRERVCSGVLKLQKIEFAHQIADIFTKGLNNAQHSYLSNKLGLFDLFQC